MSINNFQNSRTNQAMLDITACNTFQKIGQAYKQKEIVKGDQNTKVQKVEDVKNDFQLVDSIIQSVKAYDQIDQKVYSKCDQGHQLITIVQKLGVKIFDKIKLNCNICQNTIAESNPREQYKRCEICQINICTNCNDIQIRKNRYKAAGKTDPSEQHKFNASKKQLVFKVNQLMKIQKHEDTDIIKFHQQNEFVIKFEGILFPEDLLFKRKVNKDPYLSRIQSMFEKKTIKCQENDKIEKPLNLESVNEIDDDILDIQSKKQKESLCDSSDLDMDSDNENSVSDDSDDSDSIIVLKQPFKVHIKPPQSNSSKNENNSAIELDEEYKIMPNSMKSGPKTNAKSQNKNNTDLSQLIKDLNLKQYNQSDSNIDKTLKQQSFSPIGDISSLPTSNIL